MEIDQHIRIDSAYMIRLKQFYDKDTDIQICREKKKTETNRHDYSIGWWYDEMIELMRLPYHNESTYKKALDDMFWEAQDYITLFKFVGFYILRDMNAWVEEGGIKPPFGVIEINTDQRQRKGDFVIIRMEGSFEKEIFYQCNDEKLLERYNFYVFDDGATFEPLMIMDTYPDPDTVVPLSAFTKLMDDEYEITEAKICQADANFQATHPEGFLFSTPLAETQIENVSEEMRYTMDDLESAKQMTSMDRMKDAVTLAEGYCEKIRYNVNKKLPRIYKEIYGTVYQQRRDDFMRPTLKESLEPLPSSLQVSRGPPPTVLIKPEDLISRYETRICNLMGFPQQLFKSHVPIRKTGSTNDISYNLAQRQLEDVIVRQQGAFQRIYHELYRRSFMHLDIPIFNRLPTEAMPILEHLRVRIVYNNMISKSDDAIHGLLPFYEKNVISKKPILKLLERNYGIVDEEEEEEEKK